MIFGWLRNWVTSRKRCVFSYYDGRKWRQADPYVVWVSLLQDPEMDLEIDIPAMDRGDIESTTKVVNAVHRAFDLAPFKDGRGVTVGECRLLLGRFFQYAQLLKKNFERMQTLSATSDGKGSTGKSPTTDGLESS